jgi:formamidopyrimidine-DNA glycosylase
MPELPEVETLVRYLVPLLKNKKIHAVEVRRPRVIAPTTEKELATALRGATFAGVKRRGKYILFTLLQPGKKEPLTLVGHLGMTGRMYLLPRGAALPKHAAVAFDLGAEQFVYEDTRYFGRLTLDQSGPARLGPEPLDGEFTEKYFASALKKSSQAIKVKLLDQSVVAGVGNIYASESLFQAGISPKLPARKLTAPQIKRLRQSIRAVLQKAIRFGSTLPLDFAGTKKGGEIFYYGNAEAKQNFTTEQLLVYDRNGQPCVECGQPIKRLVQAARSTYYCPDCQQV